MYIRTYVRMYACMYVCMYIRTYVCMCRITQWVAFLNGQWCARYKKPHRLGIYSQVLSSVVVVYIITLQHESVTKTS